jgi:hypothetical protein
MLLNSESWHWSSLLARERELAGGFNGEWQRLGLEEMSGLEHHQQLPYIVSFPIFRKNFIKKHQKTSHRRCLYLDEGVENE